MYTPHLIHMLSGDKKSPHIRKQEVRFCSSGSNECVWSRHILTQLSFYWTGTAALFLISKKKLRSKKQNMLYCQVLRYGILYLMCRNCRNVTGKGVPSRQVMLTHYYESIFFASVRILPTVTVHWMMFSPQRRCTGRQRRNV